MKKISGLLLIFILILSGCALFEEMEEPVVEEEIEEVTEEITEEEPEEEITEEEPTEEPKEDQGEVTLNDVSLPDDVDIIGGEAQLKLNIPYTYTGTGDKAIEDAVNDIRVVLSGQDAEVTIENINIDPNFVVVEYSFPMSPKTELTRIMWGPNTPISSRKRIRFLPKVETIDTTGSAKVGGDVSDSFIRYGIPEIIKDENRDGRLIIKIEDQYKNPFTVGMKFKSGFGTNPDYTTGDLDIEFEWLILANEDGIVTWDMMSDYAYILVYPPLAMERYVVVFSSETLKEIRKTIYKKTLSPIEGAVASFEFSDDASGRGEIELDGETYTIDLKKIVGSSDPVIPRIDAETSKSSSNEIPNTFFVTGNNQGWYLVEYKK